MARFVSPTNAYLVVRCDDGRRIRFDHAGYRTDDPVELRALRAHPRVVEIIEEAQEDRARPIVRPWAVNLNSGKLHKLTRRRYHCHIPDDLLEAARSETAEAPEGWKLYQRRSDATRWNPGATACAYCRQGEEG
jgi:hypothetical protein